MSRCRPATTVVGMSWTASRTAAAALAGALVVAGSACAAPALPSPPEPTEPVATLTLPEPTGPHPLGTLELHLVDRQRTDPWAAQPGAPRELMVSIWYPARPGTDGPRAPYLQPGVAAYYDGASEVLGTRPGTVDFAGAHTHAVDRAAAAPDAVGLPVVLYSPAGGHSRAMGTTLVEELASRGYVVVTVDHTFAGPVQFPDRTERQTADLDKARMLQEQVRDIRFVLDQLTLVAAGNDPDAQRRGLPAGLPAALDLSRIGMFGHSAGGFTTAEAMPCDERIDAGANLDGSMDPHYGAAARTGSARPFLLMGGGTSGRDAHPHHHLAAPDWKAFWDLSSGWKRDLYLPVAEHMSFSDLQVLLPQVVEEFPPTADAVEKLIGTVDPQRSLAAQRAYLTAFFDEHLRGRPSTLFDGDSAEHPDVRVIR
jgi:dienelactone hydrolase